MKKTVSALALVLSAGIVNAEGFTSTWNLDRMIITDRHSVFDTVIDSSISIKGVMNVVNDKYELRGVMCDSDIDHCIRIKESLHIVDLDSDGLWADTEDDYGNTSTVHIIAREKDSYDGLNLVFTDDKYGMTVIKSFTLVEHEEFSPEFQFNDGESILESRMELDRIKNKRH